MKSICLFGDSIVWGSYDVEKGGWGTMLRNHLESAGRSYDVYNLGISAETTDTLLDHFEHECRIRQPILTVIAIGINDACEDQQKGDHQVDPETFAANLRDLTAIAKEVSNHVIYVGITPVDENIVAPAHWRDHLYYRNNHGEAFNRLIEEHCVENDCLFVPMMNVLGMSDLEDGLHPNTEGHEKMFVEIRKEVEGFLREYEGKPEIPID